MGGIISRLTTKKEKTKKISKMIAVKTYLNDALLITKTCTCNMKNFFVQILIVGTR